MQPARPPLRIPGSFSSLPVGGAPAASDLSQQPPRSRRLESSSSEDSVPPLNVGKAARNIQAAAASAAAQQSTSASSGAPIYSSFMSQSNGSTSSLNFSRPTISTAVSAARSVASLQSPSPSPLTLHPSPSSSTLAGRSSHTRKNSQTAGLFEPTLPSTSMSNLSSLMSSPKLSPTVSRGMPASQIAAQAAVLHHQNQQLAQQQEQLQRQQQQQQQQHHHFGHTRQRSQTAPVPGADHDALAAEGMRGNMGPLSPPILSLTEASAPRETGFANQGYHNGLLGNHNMAAATAANVVFTRSGPSSPVLPSTTSIPPAPPPPPPPPLPADRPKPKVKLFSRPGKISIKSDVKDRQPLPSPSKLGQALSSLQRTNFSTTSLDSTAPSFYSLANSSTATIRAVDAATGEKEGKEKEKKHHFLSRQKHKLKDRDDFHLPLSSANSNSRPTDPSAPSSLYNFNIPPSPGPNSTGFKGMSALDLRHAGRRDKKKDVLDDAASGYGDWTGSGSIGSMSVAAGSSLYLNEPFDSGKYGLNNMTFDDAWPFLKAKLYAIFEGEDLRLPVEDLNRVVTMHIQFCMARRSPSIIVDDLRDLFSTGFGSLDMTLRRTHEDRLIPALVELWMFAFTTVLPYMQAIFLPLDLEFSGNGPLMSPDQARDFWGGVTTANSPVENHSTPSLAPAPALLDVRRMVLLSFRDVVIIPRYDMLKGMFSRLSLEFLPQSLASMAMASPMPMPSPGFHSQVPVQGQQVLADSPGDSQFTLGGGGFARPGTAMSLDPSVASYNSTSTTLLGDGGSGGSGSRSRAISNVSFGSDNTGTRPFTPSSLHALGGGVNGGCGPSFAGGAGGGGGGLSSLREQNVEHSKQVTDMVGRMLQCMSVLASVGYTPSGPPAPTRDAAPRAAGDEGSRMVEELNKLLKLNWLGRGRTGRNRRGMVGGRVRRDTAAELQQMLMV